LPSSADAASRAGERRALSNPRVGSIVFSSLKFFYFPQPFN